MADFNSPFDYEQFRNVVRSERRYVRPTYIDEFLQTVAATASKRVETIEAGTVLWRAQLGHAPETSTVQVPQLIGSIDIDVHDPHPFARMKPLGGRAPEGRASSKGIPVLYLATERDTAMLEVRPWLGSTVSIASFEVKRDLLVVDCSKGSAGSPLWRSSVVEALAAGGASPAERERSVWTDIDLGFAEPVDHRSDDVASYAPTQIIAELLKHHGYDGIKYRSALSSTGHNVALFDLAAADPVHCLLVEPTKISMEFRALSLGPA